MTQYYMPRLYDFLSRVAANNNRPWFQAHKDEYDELRALWLADVDRLIAAMRTWEPGMASQTARSAAYRFYRDTRFSNDKTPYKTFFSALLSPFGRKTTYASYYVETGLPEDQAGLFAGLWMPDAATLKKVRQAMVDNIDELEEILSAAPMQRYFPEWMREYQLKTVPKGWDRQHPQADLLRLRMYGRACHCPASFFCDPAWPEAAAERLHAVKPLIDFINYSIDEEPEPDWNLV